MSSFLQRRSVQTAAVVNRSGSCTKYLAVKMAERGLLEFKVVVLGDKGVGKTCLVLRFIEVSRPALCAVRYSRLAHVFDPKTRGI